MAGNAKPNIPKLGKEAGYTVLGVSGADGSGGTISNPGLFDGAQPNEWNTARIMYWRYVSSYIEIEIHSKMVNLWRSGTTGWKQYTGHLAIKKWNGSGYDDVAYLHPQLTTQITEFQWEKWLSGIPKGRYRFEFNSSFRLDSEWYIEEVLPVNKSFILRENKYTKYKNGVWSDVSASIPTLTQFQTDGMDDLAILNRSIQLAGTQSMSNGEVLGSGKLFKSTVNLDKYFDLRKLEVK